MLSHNTSTKNPMTNEVERFLKQIGKESNWPLFEKNGYTTIEVWLYLCAVFSASNRWYKERGDTRAV